MKLRKGDKALIKRTGQVVTILDIELIRKNGKVHKYCKLQPKDGKPELWMDESELCNVVETVTATFTSDRAGHSVLVELQLNHDNGSLKIKCEAVNPENLKGQIGIHQFMVAKVLDAFGKPDKTSVIYGE